MHEPKDVTLALVGIKSIKKLNEKEDVYCMAAEINGTLIANGIVTSNCDALRYAIRTFFKGRQNIGSHKKQGADFGRTLGYTPKF